MGQAASLPVSFTLLATPLGACGLAWTSQGIVLLQLPERDDERTEKRLMAALAGRTARAVAVKKAPAWLRLAAAKVQRHLGGKPTDLSRLKLDLSGVPPFHAAVYQASLAVPSGVVVSYGDIAARVGKPGGARAVGQALGRNPIAIVVPCHRVVAAGKKPGGFTAPGGLLTKAALLALEGYDLTPAKPGRWDAEAARRWLSRHDEVLRRLIKTVGAVTVKTPTRQEPYQALAEAIVYQQLHGKAAATILGRVKALFPDQPFPTPADLVAAPMAKLRAAGLSNNKALALKDLAAKAVAGEVPTAKAARRMSDAELIKALTAIRGVGRWTVEMLLIFTLGRPDVFPADDFGVRKGFAVTFGKREMPSAKEILAFSERWKPHRSVAAWYFWRAADMATAREREASKGKRGKKGKQ